MADNILDAACQRESPQAAKRTRLAEDSTSLSLSSLKTEKFEKPHHPYNVLKGLNRLRLNSVLCDVILRSEGQEFPCHRSVLASFSSYFEAMFTSGMKESTQERVTLSGVEPQIIGLLVNYAYTSKVSISTANMQTLLAASDLLEFTFVRGACCDYMMRHIDVNNCVEIYCCADDHSCEMLKKRSMDYILENFSVIYRQEEFLSLSVERVTEILASDHLNVPKEDMVFDAAMLWLDKCPTHRQSFEKVLEQIRLPLISPSYLHTVVECLDVVKENQGCQRFISEAKERPYSNTARPRRTAVIVTVGRDTCFKRFFAKVESFDLLTKQWRTLGHLPGRVDYQAAVASGSILYLADCDCSRAPAPPMKMWRYDVHQNSWLKMAPMNVARHFFSLVMLDGYVFAVGGRGSEESEDSMERYDPNTNTWKLMESVGVAAYRDDYSCHVVALDGLLYFFGGSTTNGKPNPTQKYNPETSVWTEVASMQIPPERPAVCTLNGKIYVTGGRHGRMVLDTVQCFNPKTNLWTTCAPMQERRFDPSVVEMDGKIYVLGGRDDSLRYLSSIERYCDQTDTWETVGRMPGYCSEGVGCVSLRLRNDHTVDDTNYKHTEDEYDGGLDGADDDDDDCCDDYDCLDTDDNDYRENYREDDYEGLLEEY